MYVSSSSSYACIFLQVLSGDGWSDLARSLFARDETDETSARRTDGNVAFFFVSYMLINSIMLLNVVVAVLLVPPCVCVCVRARGCTSIPKHMYIHAGRVHFERDARQGGGGGSNARRAGETQTAAHILKRSPYSGFIQ